MARRSPISLVRSRTEMSITARMPTPPTNSEIPETLPIKSVIERLGQHPGVEIEYNRMSTQLRGEFDVVMPALTEEIRTTFSDIPKAVFAIKILNNPIN